LDPDDPVIMIYTSGTTGFPKGVMLTHHNVIANAQAQAECLNISPADRMCVAVPFFHCFGSVASNACCVATGAAMVPVELFNPAKVLETVEKEQCTVLHGVPTMFIVELEQMEKKNYDVSSLRTGIVAGAACTSDVLRKIAEIMNMKEGIHMNQNVIDILSKVFSIDIDTMSAIEAQHDLSNYITDKYRKDDKHNNLNFSVFVKDISKQHWKPKDHFTKIFNSEIDHVKELYGVTKPEVLFLYSLSPYLMWELNLIVDENNEPMNQNKLAAKMNVDRKTIQRNMKSLEEKKCVVSVWIGKEKFFIVNPYLMYCGKNINLLLPSVFIEIGYESERKNRFRDVEKRHKVSEINDTNKNI
jgi:acyl-CoA synthetase (AMP-forming)/AMP-acid ligase II